MKKTISSIAISTFVIAGIVFAASASDNSGVGSAAGVFDTLRVGKQGVGGVTFFNGTIVNETTTDGADNPVTFGDDVRVDGAIQRGTNKPNDTWPVKIGDDLLVEKNAQVDGNLTVNGDVKTDGTMKYLSLDSSSFVPESNSHQYTRSPHLTPTNNASIVYYTPVSLPDGAKLKNVLWSYKDNDATGAVIISLEEVDTTDGSVSTVFNTASTNDEKSDAYTSKALSLSDEVISSSTKAYRMKVTLPGTNYSLAYVTLGYEVTNL